MKKKIEYRQPKGRSLFEDEITLETLSKLGNPLERLSKVIDFEMFRPELEAALLTKECKTLAGRKPIDVVLLFKILFLQRYYGLGNHQIQYQIVDRTSFRNFLGIQTADEVPDENTVWACKDKLSSDGAFDRLFDRFRSYLDSFGLSFSEGKIIDASFVEAPRQRNTRQENDQIKEGKGGELWQPEAGDSERERKRKQHKRSHKDIDARWTKKRGESHYGYKVHVKVDFKTKLIERHHTTDASVHDSNVLVPLIEDRDKGQTLWLDAGYEGREDVIMECGMVPAICEKGHRNHPLTDEQKQSNRGLSHFRSRVEHVFGFVEGAMCGSIVRCIGMVRAKAMNALTCLIYNVCRFEQIIRCQPEIMKQAQAQVDLQG